MIYKPHILQVLKYPEIEYDDLGNPIKKEGEWSTISDCNCHDNGSSTKISVNGILYDYNYNVVYEGEKIPVGMKVRCVDKSDGSVRGEGTVIRSYQGNYLRYAQIWIE